MLAPPGQHTAFQLDGVLETLRPKQADDFFGTDNYSFKLILMGSARREAVSCNDCMDAGARATHGAVAEALARRGSHSTPRASNTADGRLSPCPEGVTEPRHCCVAALDKGPAIACELRLALARLGGSEPGNITLKEY